MSRTRPTRYVATTRPESHLHGHGRRWNPSGALAYHGPTRSLRFRPDPLPAPGARVTGTLSTQARDLAGNALEAPFTFTFRSRR